MLDYYKLKNDDLYFPDVSELQDSEYYETRIDKTMTNHFDNESFVVAPIKDFELPIFTLNQENYFKCFLPYIYKGDSIFIPNDHLKEGDIISINFNLKEEKIIKNFKGNFHGSKLAEFYKNSKLISEQFKVDLEPEVDDRFELLNDEPVPYFIEYLEEEQHLTYNNRLFYYHPNEIHKDIEGNIILMRYNSDHEEKIKKWFKDNDINPLKMTIPEKEMFYMTFPDRDELYYREIPF